MSFKMHGFDIKQVFHDLWIICIQTIPGGGWSQSYI